MATDPPDKALVGLQEGASSGPPTKGLPRARSEVRRDAFTEAQAESLFPDDVGDITESGSELSAEIESLFPEIAEATGEFSAAGANGPAPAAATVSRAITQTPRGPYPAYRGLYRDFAEAIPNLVLPNHLKPTDRKPYINPSKEYSIEQAEKDNLKWVRLFYMGMTNVVNIKDNPSARSRGIVKFVEKAEWPQNVLEIACHMLTRDAFDLCRNGFSLTENHDHTMKIYKGDRELKCSDRMLKIYYGLKYWKLICDDVVPKGDGDILRKEFINAPIAYRLRKEDNKHNNQARGKILKGKCAVGSRQRAPRGPPKVEPDMREEELEAADLGIEPFATDLKNGKYSRISASGVNHIGLGASQPPTSGIQVTANASDGDPSSPLLLARLQKPTLGRQIASTDDTPSRQPRGRVAGGRSGTSLIVRAVNDSAQGVRLHQAVNRQIASTTRIRPSPPTDESLNAPNLERHAHLQSKSLIQPGSSTSFPSMAKFQQLASPVSKLDDSGRAADSFPAPRGLRESTNQEKGRPGKRQKTSEKESQQLQHDDDEDYDHDDLLGHCGKDEPDNSLMLPTVLVAGARPPSTLFGSGAVPLRNLVLQMQQVLQQMSDADFEAEFEFLNWKREYMRRQRERRNL